MSEADDDSRLVVGLDFAFCFPVWFLEERGLESAREAWRLAAEEGEEWLADCNDPFWGRPGKTKPDLPDDFRRTERSVQRLTAGAPKSVFQIGGGGAVGTGSVRGMPHLLRLADGDFSIWPFDEPSFPLVVEIYPRLFTIGVNKTDPDARRAYLETEFPQLSEAWLDRAAETADAFDAAASALAMARHAGTFAELRQTEDSQVRVEGAIWHPHEHSALQRALLLATDLHADQTRKGGEGVPYVAHLLGVASLVLEAGGDEEQAVAALLHDAAEDQGGRETLAEIRRRFGGRAARIVEACTDTFVDPKPAWRPRKEAYVEDLEREPADALLVACADKLYNARSIVRDYHRVGEAVFERFNADRASTLWYYRSVADALARSELDSWLVAELERTVAELESVAAEG